MTLTRPHSQYPLNLKGVYAPFFYMFEKVKILREKLSNIDVMSEVFLLLNQKPEIRDEMIQANRDQLRDGIKTDGSKITPNYTPQYKSRRARLGLQTAYVDLKLNGELWNKIDMYVKKDSILFFSRVPYAQYMEKRYATRQGHIFGLTDENLNILKRNLIINIRLKIGL